MTAGFARPYYPNARRRLSQSGDWDKYLFGHRRNTIGTHIDAFFPHSVEPSPEVVRDRLVAAFADLKEDLDAIRERGRFSASRGEWWLVAEDGIVSGEGPSGFSIAVYRGVVEFTSVERFGAVEQPDLGIHLPLRRVFETVAGAFGARGRLAVAAGGFGDTDKAGELAIGGAGFVDVCGCLEAVIGAPARSWEELEAGEGAWYLSGQAEPVASADGGRDAGSS